MDEEVSIGEKVAATITSENSHDRPKRIISRPLKYQDHLTSFGNSSQNTEDTSNTKLSPASKDLCICKQPWSKDEGDSMTFCEYCKQWLHYECAGVMLEKVKEIEKFVCMPCSMKLYVQLNESSKITESVDLSESRPLVSVKFQEEITVLKNANTVLQNQVDYLSAARAQNEQMKPEIKALKEQAGTTSQDMIKLKEDLQEKEKSLASSENSLEIMNRRCASLEKEKLINERSILALKDQNEEYRQKAEDLQSKISELQLEGLLLVFAIC